jgi:hypothetical protein
MVPIMLIAAFLLFLACSVGALLASSARPLVANLHRSPQQVGPFPTVVSPAAIWGSGEDGDAAIHVEFIAPVRVHMVPDQGRDGLLVTESQTVGPVGLSQALLQHEGVDERHAVLEQVQAEHAEFVILMAIAAELAATGEEYEVVGTVPLLDHFDPVVDFPT